MEILTPLSYLIDRNHGSDKRHHHLFCSGTSDGRGKAQSDKLAELCSFIRLVIGPSALTSPSMVGMYLPL